MIDKRIKFDCPFCGEQKENIQIKVIGVGLNKIYCPKCRCTFESWGSKQEVIDKWNCRT